jgi:hypothetical protein
MRSDSERGRERGARLDRNGDENAPNFGFTGVCKADVCAPRSDDTNGTSLAQVAFSKRLAIISGIIINKYSYIYFIQCGLNFSVSYRMNSIKR